MTDHNDTIEQIIHDFKQHRWNAKPFERTMEIVVSHPDKLEHLITTALAELNESSTFTDAAMSFIDKAAFSRLVSEAFAVLERVPNHQMAESVIGQCSFQFPDLLHPQLTRIFELAPNADSYIENYPWRDSGQTHFAFLSLTLNDSTQPPATRLKAWFCLLETRDIESLRWARQQSHQTELHSSLPAYLNEVGFCVEDEEIRTLTTGTTFHIVFDADYPIDRESWQRIHPTWQLPSEDQTRVDFGGNSISTCSACGGALHHLITLRLIPQGIGITELANLQLACCLSCLGWEQAPLFYQHDEFGIPTSIDYDKTNVSPKFIATSFQATKVVLAKTPSRWCWQDWAYSNSRENLNRLGGYPSWIQSAEYPTCPRCRRLMPFLLQLDSDLPTQDGRTWLWGSGGIGYAFWCDQCKISAYLWQCT
jgi:hypothetical protein